MPESLLSQSSASNNETVCVKSFFQSKFQKSPKNPTPMTLGMVKGLDLS